jgi:endonuclease/exonuclease/phosphatase family metal-dependent hydrolase
MKIMSWNILASEWIKKSDYPKVDKKTLFNRSARFIKILEIIIKVNADIILLQEVMPLEYTLLKKKLQKNYACSPLMPIEWKYTTGGNKDILSKSGNITFIRRDLQSDAKVKHYSLEFGIYTETSSLSIFNIHLDDLSIQTRNKQIKSIEPILYRKPKCIIGGDFNQSYRTNSRIYNLPEFTVHNIECPTYYIEQKMNIDNIMTRGFHRATANATKNRNKKKEDKCIAYPTSMEEGIETYGSDHLPVITSV